jgi:hypothetical protein
MLTASSAFANQQAAPLSSDAAMLTSSSFAYEQRSLNLAQPNGYLPSMVEAHSPQSPQSPPGGAAGAFQMRNLPLNAPPNLVMTAAELIRVDCVQLTTNGRYVVTGSVNGPPQVWDLKVCVIIFCQFLFDTRYFVKMMPQRLLWHLQLNK